MARKPQFEQLSNRAALGTPWRRIAEAGREKRRQGRGPARHFEKQTIAVDIASTDIRNNQCGISELLSIAALSHTC